MHNSTSLMDDVLACCVPTKRMKLRARFWIWVNGSPVKITLKPGQTIERYWRGPTDEGWSSDYESWTFDAESNIVVREWETDGRDCDGRLTQSGEDFCPLDKLNAIGPSPLHGIRWPEWTTDTASQRDYTAEAAGY